MWNTVVSVYYRLPDQEEGGDKAFYGHLEIASQSQMLVLMGSFTHPGICWRDNMAQCAQSRKFLQITEEYFNSGGGTNEERCVARPCTYKPVS